MIIPSQEQLEKCTREAIAKAHAKGIPVCIVRDGVVGFLYPDGTFKSYDDVIDVNKTC